MLQPCALSRADPEFRYHIGDGGGVCNGTVSINYLSLISRAKKRRAPRPPPGADPGMLKKEPPKKSAFDHQSKVYVVVIYTHVNTF